MTSDGNKWAKRIRPSRGDREVLYGPREVEAAELEVLAVHERKVLAVHERKVLVDEVEVLAVHELGVLAVHELEVLVPHHPQVHLKNNG
jgi:hypothetical protein